MGFETKSIDQKGGNNPFQVPNSAPSLEELDEKFQEQKKRRNWKELELHKKAFHWGSWLAVIVTVFVFGWLVFALWDLPSMDFLREGGFDQSTKVFDKEGGLLYEIHGETTGRRTIVGLDEVSSNFIKALLAAEDDEFFSHGGFDWKGLVQGAIINPLTGKKIRGGSTITQQLIKNSLLTPERTVKRKVRELVLALMAENEFTKDEILGMHVNQVPFGSNAYGISAASKTFFDKKASELSLAEAATLAAIQRAPTWYSPYGNNVEDLIWRRDWILSRMNELGMISEKEMTDAQNESLEVVPYREEISAPHFVMMVKEMLVDAYGEDVVEQGGLSVFTTLDPEMQEAAEEAISGRREFNTDYYDATNAALVAADPKTGEVLAWVGSYDYFDQEIDGAVNVPTRERQPGSSIKPFAYAAAFLKGYSPATVVYDVKTDFAVGGDPYEPWNYDELFRGPVSLRQALAQSLNVPAVKTLFLAGIQETIELLNKMGISTLMDPERYGLSLVLGGGEVKLAEMVEAYSTFADQGKHKDLQFVKMVQDAKGRVLFEMEEPEVNEVLDENVAYLVTDILKDNNARIPAFGEGNKLNLGERPVAAKTGTTNEYRDAWTLGYTPSLVAGVWAGNNDNHEMKNKGGGAGAAAPIWNAFMTKALKNDPIEEFEIPSGVRWVEVSSLSGKIPSRFTPANKIVKEVFLEENVPVDEDDFYQAASVNSVDGLLANKWCPEGSIEWLIFENWHSILPEKSNWEEAVRKWAATFTANRLEKLSAGEEVSLPDFGVGSQMKFVSTLGDVPTEVSPLCTEEVFNMKSPILRVVEPGDMSRVRPGSEVEVTVAVTETDRPVEQVEFWLNNERQDIATRSSGGMGKEAFFQGLVKVNEGVEGEQILKVVVLDDLGHKSEVKVTLESVIDKIPPKVEVISPPAGAEIFWNTRTKVKLSVRDEESEVEMVQIYWDELTDENWLTALKSAPFEWEWFVDSNLGEGEHTLIVRAFDTQGNFSKVEQKVMIKNPAAESSIVPGEKIGAIVEPNQGENLRERVRVPIIAKFRSLRYVSDLVFYVMHDGGQPQLIEQFEPENNEKFIQTAWAPNQNGTWEIWFRATFTNGSEVESERVRVSVE